MYEEAADLLGANVRDGVRNADIFRWLARLYRAQGDEVTAMQAAAEAAKYMRQTESPSVIAAPIVAPRAQRAAPPLPAPDHVAPPLPSPKKKSSTMKTLAIGCAAVVLGICAIGAIGSLARSGSSQSISQPTAAPQLAAQPTTVPQAPAAAAKPAAPAAVPATSAPAAPPATATSRPEPKPATLPKVGERVESGGIAITVLNTKRTDSAGQFMKAKPGRTFLIAEVTIESVTRDNAPYNPLYFKVKDSEGQEYDAGLIGPDNGLKSGELPRGDRVRGAVSFDVPSEAKGLVMSYQPIVIFGGYQTIRIQLE
jgi:hypothetical protein